MQQNELNTTKEIIINYYSDNRASARFERLLLSLLHTYIRTNLYSAKNRENEYEALAQDD